MAQFPQQNQNQMRRDAMRRAKEMQQRVYPVRRQPSTKGDYPPASPSYSQPPPVSPPPPPPLQPSPQLESMQSPDALPLPQQEKVSAPNHPRGAPMGGLLSQLNPSEIFSNLDGDSMLILALMAMLYQNGGKNGCDKKLLMALAYLLT